MDYEQLVDEAVAAQAGGWDFGWLSGRAHGGDPSWSYPDLIRSALPGVECLLDVDTGGGELLSTFTPLPPTVLASESWPPNLPLARSRLEPLGVKVLAAPGNALPVESHTVDLVTNRHGRLDANETARVLRPGGKLITQQVGSDDCEDLNARLGAPPGHAPDSWTLEKAVAQLENNNMEIEDAREEFPSLVFYDIGSVVFQLRKIAWQIPDFDPVTYDHALRALHRQMPLTVHSHRLLIVGEWRG